MYTSLKKKEIKMKARNVYVFIERLKDLKYIIKAKIIFKRYRNLLKPYNFNNNNDDNDDGDDFLLTSYEV